MQPEHFDFSRPVFLPITLEVCQGLLEAEGAPELDALSEPELAALLVIQNLAQSQGQLDARGAEKVLGKLLAWAVEGVHSPGVGLLSEARRLFDARKLYFGLEVIKGSKLRLLDAEEVAAREYLLADGKWDFEFRIRRQQGDNPFSQQVVTGFDKERWLTVEQDKLLKVIRANLDEDIHVQGYAGIGKSYLLGALMDCLPGGRVLALARTPAKLGALRQRMGLDAQAKVGTTFGQFARVLLKDARPANSRTPVPGKRKLAEELGILGLRQYDAEHALEICLEVLQSYCQSRDYSLANRHLPFFRQALSAADAQALLEYASRLWRYLEANPAWGAQTGFEALLLIKRASLAGCSVPGRFSHVIIDESQDAPASLLQIIERGRQVLITLGDEYQKATGEVVRRERQVRHKDMAFAVRSGPKVERLINPLIGMHSRKSKVQFEAARSVDVGIEHYPQGFVPPEGCVVLTASRWDTMRWAMELAEGNCLLAFPDWPDMRRFMASAVGLFRAAFYASGQDAADAHPYFAHLPDWQQVRESERFDESFLWVEARLQGGYKFADLTCLDARVSDTRASLTLMMAQEAGGLEFDQVLLTPELMSTQPFRDAYAFDARICAVYIALSRARRQLYLPYDVQEWIDYHKGQPFRELHGY
ncbi:hypothetical protein KSS93_21180 [Pseudomonas xanthosomatis]|uniref:hypothetical protein n=1 Tax=Pseudomonas xanthosomatis TaxID=2842356 RepID=UPI001C3E24E9|nr:hypothetical protein [Pseudomonas xanthosomatis]QXH45369.1 hypothetical protein KSS93_21180 [Pseudomonas xanthosomatis]